MDKLKQMEAFVHAADQGSLAKAARIVGITPAMLGRRISSLERRLGVRLLHRSQPAFLDGAVGCCDALGVLVVVPALVAVGCGGGTDGDDVDVRRGVLAQDAPVTIVVFSDFE